MMRSISSVVSIAMLVAACGGSKVNEPGVASRTVNGQSAAPGKKTKAVAKQSPPASGPSRDVSFPPVVRSELKNGLELNSVEWKSLPLVSVRLVVQSGRESDPKDRVGLSGLVASMMKEGTRKRSSEQLAQDVEFLGADLRTGSDEETLYISVRALSKDFEKAMELLADVATQPAFRTAELKKLKRREMDRLTLQENDPGFLAAREFHKRVYGAHPYANIDTTADVVNAVKVGDLKKWHRSFCVPNNAFLVVVGDVSKSRIEETAEKVFARWKKKEVKAPTYPELPSRSKREIVVVDRPSSVQSMIIIGNPALRRKSDDYVPLLVANQVLGGSAASRLFMDLREKRSLTYGAYSRVTARVGQGVFRASAAVRTEVTGQALGAFEEHLKRIVAEPAPKPELQSAIRFLSDRFPLQIDTPGKIGAMLADLRVFGLEDGYWDQYRSQIRGIATNQAFSAAKKYIHPGKELIVIVGDANKVVPMLKPFGKPEVVKSQPASKDAKEASKG